MWRVDRGSGLSLDEANVMIRELKTGPLLDGCRGRQNGDVSAFASAIVAFSQMALLGDTLLEAEINPIFVLAEGQGVRVADGVAVLADTSHAG